MDGQPMEQHEKDSLYKSLREKGLDPATVVSCAPRAGKNGLPGVHGCSQYESCIFGRQRYGGFKGSPGGHIPHNIVYRIKPNDGTHNQKEDELACYLFMQTLYRKMQAGRRAAEEGMKAEEIDVIGGEGDEYLYGFYGRSKDWTPLNNMAYSDQVERRVCSTFKFRGATSGDSYSAQVERRARDRAVEVDEDRPLPKGRKVTLPGESTKAEKPETPEELDMVLGATTEPAKKGKAP